MIHRVNDWAPRGACLQCRALSSAGCQGIFNPTGTKKKQTPYLRKAYNTSLRLVWIQFWLQCAPDLCNPSNSGNTEIWFLLTKFVYFISYVLTRVLSPEYVLDWKKTCLTSVSPLEKDIFNDIFGMKQVFVWSKVLYRGHLTEKSNCSSNSAQAC